MDSNAPQLVRVMIVMIVVPFMFMTLRFYCKVKYSGKLGWDDSILALSWVRILYLRTLLDQLLLTDHSHLIVAPLCIQRMHHCKHKVRVRKPYHSDLA
jgi:hypothetical protein